MMNLVLIQWTDASSGSAWSTAQELEQQKMPIVESVGWIFRKTKESVHLVMGIGPGNMFLGDIIIPIGMIRKTIRIGNGELDREERTRTDSSND